MRRSALGTVAALVAAALVAGCGGTTETETNEPTVTLFEVGELVCDEGETTGPVEVAWATANATNVDFAVDSTEGALPFGPKGSTSVLVPCDGEEHEVTIIPWSNVGEGESESETVGP